MSTKKNVAVVYAGWDGLFGSYTGIGVLTQDLLKAMPEVANFFKSKNVNVSLHVVAVEAARSNSGYSKEINLSTEKICKLLGGELKIINQASSDNVRGGAYNFWNHISKETAEIVSSLSNRYDETIVYLTTMPHFATPYYLDLKTQTKDNVKLILVPPPASYSYFVVQDKFEKLQWEAGCYQLINQLDNTYVAATSKYQISSLEAAYVLPADKIVSLQTGLFIKDERFLPMSKKQNILALRKYNIPIDADLIFSVGRASPSKGFVELLKTYAQLIKTQKGPTHIVLIVAPNQQFEGSAQTIEQVKQLIKDNNLEDRCTPIYKLDMELRQHIYQWERTKIVAMLSLEESFGLVPEEARISPNDFGPIVVASNVGGHKEQITNGKDGFLVDPHAYKQTAETMSKILNMPEPELAKIREAGLKRAKRDYDYSKNVRESLNALIN